MHTVNRVSRSAGGRPRIGDPVKVRFPDDFMEWAQKYADRRHDGNVNAALREVAARGRMAIDEESADQQEQGAAA